MRDLYTIGYESGTTGDMETEDEISANTVSDIASYHIKDMEYPLVYTLTVTYERTNYTPAEGEKADLTLDVSVLGEYYKSSDDTKPASFGTAGEQIQKATGVDLTELVSRHPAGEKKTKTFTLRIEKSGNSYVVAK